MTPELTNHLRKMQAQAAHIAALLDAINHGVGDLSHLELTFSMLDAAEQMASEINNGLDLAASRKFQPNDNA